MKSILPIAFYLAALSSFPLLAFAGVVIRQERVVPGTEMTQKSTMYVKGGRIRTEEELVVAGQRLNNVTIFDANRQVLWVLEPEKGIYTEITAAALARQMEQVMTFAKLLQETMARMPAEQRALMEPLGKKETGATDPPKAPTLTITFQTTGHSDKIGAFTCSMYDVLTDGKRTAEICVAPLDQLHLRDADVGSFQAQAKLTDPTNTSRQILPAFLRERIPGFPVHIVTYDGDQAISETTVLSAEQKSLDPSMFTVPEGLEKSDLFGNLFGPPPR
jgi:hypothetical protein